MVTAGELFDQFWREVLSRRYWVGRAAIKARRKRSGWLQTRAIAEANAALIKGWRPAYAFAARRMSISTRALNRHPWPRCGRYDGRRRRAALGLKD